MKKILSISGFFLIFSTYIFAGRPLKTDDAETVEKGKFELEVGYDFMKNDTNSQQVYISLKSGLTSWMDFGVVLPYTIEDEDQDINDWQNAEICAKFSILKESEKHPGIAFTISGVINPDQGDTEYALNLIISKGFGKVTTHFNFGTYSEEGGDNYLTYSAASEYGISEKINLVGEIVGEKNDDEEPLEMLVGLNYALNENLVFDIGISFGLNDDAPDYRITTGFTLNW